jgi:ribosomal protein S18 acetylase RimI-like enzyme
MSEAALVVRTATEDDVPSLARIHVAAWGRAFRGLVPDEVLDSADQAKRAARFVEMLRNPALCIHAAVADHGVVGFCVFGSSRDADAAPWTAEIDGLYVHPDHWRRGVGRLMVDSALEVVRKKSFEALTLWTLESSAQARRFYERIGFQLDSHRVVTLPTYSRAEVRYRRELPRSRG